ncbi:MAG: hypothetical protein JAZ11_03035 [Candidatus Thiodiazotropha lotti]|nr:hypothetical protein [Candidatus Thiodiazotropha lotti]
MSIRVVLNVSAANPELRDELEVIPLRHRAERIRSLATLGLMMARGGIGVASGGGVAVATEYISGVDEIADGAADDQDDPTNPLVESFVQGMGGF